MPGVVDRLHWIGTLPRPAFLGLNSVCDVMLDPLHFGGGNTTLEAFALGVPVVSLPSPYLRARLTAGYYRKIGMEDLLSKDQDSYIADAVKLATDRDWKHHTRERLRENAGKLFEDAESLRGFEEYFASNPS